jgi:hypothetical protein
MRYTTMLASAVVLLRTKVLRRYIRRLHCVVLGMEASHGQVASLGVCSDRRRSLARLLGGKGSSHPMMEQDGSAQITFLSLTYGNLRQPNGDTHACNAKQSWHLSKQRQLQWLPGNPIYLSSYPATAEDPIICRWIEREFEKSLSL